MMPLSLTQRYLVAVVIGLSLAVRLLDIQAYSFWVDEVFSINAAQQSWYGLWDNIREDLVHPPLFYLLLKLWLIPASALAPVAEPELTYRLFSMTFSLLCFWPLLRIGRQLGLSPTARLVLCVLFSFNLYWIWYAQQLRMYALLGFLSLLAFTLLLEWLQQQKRLWLLTLVYILMVYTQYFGWLMIVSHFVVVLLLQPRQWWRHGLASSLVMLAFLPWVYQLWQVVQQRQSTTQTGLDQTLAGNLSWIQAPDLSALVYFFSHALSHTSSGWLARGSLLLIILASIVFWLTIGLRRSQAIVQPVVRRWLVLASLTVIPPMIAFTAAQFIPQAPWGHRHLMISVTPLLMLLIYSLDNLPPAWNQLTLFATGLSSVLVYAAAPRPVYEHIDYRPLTAYMQQEPGTVYTLEQDEFFLQTALHYYWPAARYDTITSDQRLPSQSGWFIHRLRTTSDQPSVQQFLQPGCSLQLALQTNGPDYTVVLYRHQCI